MELRIKETQTLNTHAHHTDTALWCKDMNFPLACSLNARWTMPFAQSAAFTMHLCGINSLLLLVLVQNTHDAGLTLCSFRGNNIEAHIHRV